MLLPKRTKHNGKDSIKVMGVLLPKRTKHNGKDSIKVMGCYYLSELNIMERIALK